MWRVALTDGEYLSLTPRCGDLGAPWDLLVPAGMLLVPALLIVILFRHEASLVRPWSALFLGGIRLTILAVIWFVVLFQPSVVREQEETLPSRLLVAVDRSDSMATRDPQRPPEEASRLAQALGLGGADGITPADPTRGEIVARLLEPGPMDLLRRWREVHEVETIGFRTGIRKEIEFGKKSDRPWKEGSGTDFRPVLERAGEEVEGKAAFLGVVLLSDGRHNIGSYPLEQARRLGRRGIPIFTVGIGSSVPPAQLLVREVRAPAQILRNADFRLQARIDLQGLPPQEVLVELRRRGGTAQETQTRRLKHDGKTVRQEVEFALKGEHVGTHAYEVRVVPEKGPAPGADLRPAEGRTIVRVLQDKVRVLLVDGEARWEHHFLAGALRRDPDVALETILFDQPVIGGVEKKARPDAGLPGLDFPEVPKEDMAADPLSDFDVVILGDVPPDRFSLDHRKRLERFVADRGGTLVLAAGKRHLPLEYSKSRDGDADPLAKMVPVRSPRKIGAEKGFALVPTPAGERHDFLKLSDQAEANRQVWSGLPRHFWAVVGEPAPAAAVLAATANADVPELNGLPLLIEQGYGLGKVLWIGLDSTWRWRFRKGDEFHHRFWGQVVRWAGVQELLPAGDRVVRFGTRRPVHDADQDVDVAVRILGDRPLPKEGKVRVVRRRDGVEETVAEAVLHPDPTKPRVLQAKVSGLAPGEYGLRPDLPGIPVPASPKDASERASPDVFLVESPPPSQEMLDLSCDWEGLRGLALESGGRFVPAEEAARLIDWLQARREVRKSREEVRPWQDPPLVWGLFGLVLGLLTLEWVGRKLVGLP